MEIKLPPIGHVRSALDGYQMQALDTDPDTSLGLLVRNAHAHGIQVVTVLPRQFTPTTRGYLVVTFDPSKAHAGD